MMEESDSSPSDLYAPGGKRSAEKRKLNDPMITIHTTPKRKRIFGPEQGEEHQDVYCWECHRPCVEGCLDCSTCPRTYHPRCLNVVLSNSGNWSCPACTQIMKAEMADTRSWAMQMLSLDKLATLLTSALQRMKHPESEPFHHPILKSELPDYYDLVFHPMDMSVLEKNVKRKMYASTEAFLEDAKWILHNCIIYNGPTSKFTSDARLIIKIAKHEMNEIEICPECYSNSSLRKDNWFTEPCTFPHCLVWAKLKGFPFWPAKALRISGSNNVDVRFFGAHDRSWIPLSQCYLLSQECPVSVKSTKKYGLDQAMSELETHLNRIREKFGTFNYAPPRTEFQPDHLINCEILFGSDIASKVPNYSGRKPLNTSSGAASCAIEESYDGDLSSLDLQLHLQEDEEMSPERRGVSDSRNSSNGDGDDSLAVLDTSGSHSGGQPHQQEVHEEDNQEDHAEAMDEHFNADPVVESNQISSRHSHEKSFTVEEIEAKLRVTEARLRQSIAGEGHLPHNDDSDGEDDEMDDLPPARLIRPSQAQTFTGHSGSSVGNDMRRTAITSSLAQAKAQALKKRSLTSCLQKLHQKSDKPQSPVTGTGSERASDTPGPSESDVAVVGGHDSDSRDGKAAVFRRYSQKVTQLLLSTFEDLYSELGHGIGDGSNLDGAAAVTTTSNNMEIKNMRHELNRMAWIQKQAMSEMEHHAKLTIAEMQEQFSADKQRYFEEQKRKFDEEKQRAIAETKQKQWCAACGREAMFYCCWNTSYCDYPCQQQHWPKHQDHCAQIRQPQTTPEVQTGGYHPGPGSVSTSIQQPQVHYVQGPVGLVPVYANSGGAGIRAAPPHTIVSVSTGANPSVGNHLYPAMQPRPPGNTGGAQVVRRR